MLKLLKVNFIIILITMMICGSIHTQAGTKTGHKEFNEIKFQPGSNEKLIIDFSNVEKNELFKKVKRKAFGWSTKVNILNRTVSYTADTIFARSNHTNQVIAFSYATSSTRKKQVTQSLAGTLSLKASGKISDISLNLDESIRSEIGYKTEISFEEKTDFDFKINPGKKISLIVKGYANLSNGASKFYFLGIGVNKMLWEYVDIVNEYYEIYEEEI